MLLNMVVRPLMTLTIKYLNAQNRVTLIMFSSALAVASHVPINILLSKSKGLACVSMAVWIDDLIVYVDSRIRKQINM